MTTSLATASDVEALAPELASVDGDLMTAYLGMAAEMINPTVWGSKTSYGHALLAAHMLTAAGGIAVADGGAGSGASAGGQLASITVGPVSKSYATASVSASGSIAESIYMGTRYGQQYLVMRRSLPRMPLALRSGYNRYKGGV